jgi:predicted small secreted protein
MKALALLLAILPLASCNTMIGIGRDSKEGYQWTKTKWQQSRQARSQPQGDPYGAPVY